VNISDVVITSAQHAQPSKAVVACHRSQGFLNASEVVHPHAHATKCQGISETSSKILESRKKKNLGNFRILEEKKNLSKSQKKKNLRISEEEKYLGMRKISESRNKRNLGISRILESRQPRVQSRNLATSSVISKQVKSWNLSRSEISKS
jgi:hypothetical protein